jgi:hypothetical protein
MGSHNHTGDKEPDGIAEGLRGSASQQSKHFQRGSATVLCTTVNSKAQASLRNVPGGRFWVRRDATFALW